MKFYLIAFLFLSLSLSGCVTAWEQEPSGIYPSTVATLNGPPIYFVGWKLKL